MRAIITKYHGETKTLPSRASATVSLTAGKNECVYVNYCVPNDSCPFVRALRKLCNKMNWVGYEWTEGELKNGNSVWVSDRGRKVAI